MVEKQFLREYLKSVSPYPTVPEMEQGQYRVNFSLTGNCLSTAFGARSSLQKQERERPKTSNNSNNKKLTEFLLEKN